MDDEWTPQLAEETAGREGITLGEKHWCVIATSREVLARGGRVASLADIGKACGVTVNELKTLFPGAAQQLARVAGAPEFERSQ